MITVEHLSIEYSSRPILDDITFLINPRDRVALVGKNGAGKTTLLRLLAGVETPSSGRISKMGDITIGYLPQVMMHVDGKTLREDVLSVIANRESDTDTEHTEEKKNSTAEETKPAETTENKEPSESVTESEETKPAETKPQTTVTTEPESKPTESMPKETEPKPTEIKPAETTPPQTKPTEPPKTEQPKATEPAVTEPPKQTTEQPKETEPVVTEPPKVTEPPAQTQQPEVTEPEKESFTEADHKRIIAEVTAYANSYANKGFTFEWKESMTFGWDVGYMGTPRVKYEGVDGVIETLKYHIDLIYKTSTDPMYGITTEYMTYKVEQITVDGDLAYAVIYGG